MKRVNSIWHMDPAWLSGRAFWMLVAPIYALIDGRFRRYLESRQQAATTPSHHSGVGLPSRDSITSWDVRDRLARLHQSNVDFDTELQADMAVVSREKL